MTSVKIKRKVKQWIYFATKKNLNLNRQNSLVMVTKLSSIFEVGISYWFSYYNKKNPDLPCPGRRGSTSTRQPPSKGKLLRFQETNIDETWAQL